MLVIKKSDFIPKYFLKLLPQDRNFLINVRPGVRLLQIFNTKVENNAADEPRENVSCAEGNRQYSACE